MKLHWGNAIVIFFAVFLSLAITFIIFSLRQDNDLVDANYYEKGAAYGTQMDINSRSEIYTDSIEIKSTSRGVEITLCPSIRQHTSRVNAHFYRPSSQKFDYKWDINTNDSVATLDKALLIKGRYIVKLHWSTQDQSYALEKNLMVK